MNIQATDTIDSIVSRNVKMARVLNKHGIDYCSEGGRSIREACREANISFRRLMRNIDAAYHDTTARPDIQSLTLEALTRFIERYHHAPAYENLTFIQSNLLRLVRIFGKAHSELEEMSSVFRELKAHITIHMQYEELVVFPYIRDMTKQGRKTHSAIFKSAGSPLPALFADHEKATPYRHRLDELTHHYAVPPAQASIFKVTYDAMKEFESELFAHMMIENEILFPKAMALESRLKKITWLSQN